SMQPFTPRCSKSPSPQIRSTIRSACCGRPSSAKKARPPLSKNEKPPPGGGFRLLQRGACGLLLEPEPRELLLEAPQASATVGQLLGAGGPGRKRLRIDIKVERVALLAPGGAGGEFGAVGHDDLDGMVVRVRVGLHGERSCGSAVSVRNGWIW